MSVAIRTHSQRLRPARYFEQLDGDAAVPPDQVVALVDAVPRPPPADHGQSNSGASHVVDPIRFKILRIIIKKLNNIISWSSFCFKSYKRVI